MNTSNKLPAPVERILKFAGKQRREVSNPCLTANETIVVANWMRSLIDATARKCQYPDCVENADGTCTDWLVGDCKGPGA